MEDELENDVLSYFENDEDDGVDSADELLDMLDGTSDAVTSVNGLPESHDSNSNDSEIDDDTKAQIAALQAKIKLLKSTKSVKKTSSDAQSKTDKKNNVDTDNGMLCKHGKQIHQCFFCTKPTEEEEPPKVKSEFVKKRVVSPGIAAAEKETVEKTTGKGNQEDGSINIFDVLPIIEGENSLDLSKKRRLAHESKLVNNNTEKECPRKKVKVEREKVDTKVTPKPLQIQLQQASSSSKGNAHAFAGIEVSNPILSSTIFDERTKGRKLIKISKIETTVVGQNFEGDWVTVGVVVKKVVQKKSANGKNFCVWHLSDLCLGSENNVVGFFLFGECYNQHWKIQVGRTIALLNPDIMKQDDKFSNQQIAIKIDNPKKLMELGDAKFLGGCKGNRKSDGKPCTMYVNKRYGEYCEYHVQAAFKKAKSGRMDLQSGGRAPRKKGKMLNNLRKDISTGDYYYGGKTVTLQEEKVKPKLPINEKSGGLKSVLGHQIRLQASMEYNEAKRKKELETKSSQDHSASMFLRNNRNELLNLTSNEKKLSTKCAPVVFDGVKTKTSQQNGKEKVNKPKSCNLDFFSEIFSEKKNTCMTEKSTCNKKPSLGLSKSPKRIDDSGRKCSVKEKKKPLKVDTGKFNPILGRGLNADGIIEFCNDDDFSYEKHTGEELLLSQPCTLKKGFSKDLKTELENKHVPVRSIQAKRHAISIVQNKGQIEFQDPNIDRVNKKKSPKGLKNIEKVLNKCEKTTSNEETKPKKKGILSGVLGHIDLNSEDGKKLLQQKSKNIGAVKLAEAEREEKYFDSLEKKENMSTKMSSLFETKVNGVACRECQYLAESQSELCKELNHAIAKIPNVTKRFFLCKSCKQRCCSYNKLLPKKPCTRCGENNYEKTSMAVERKGPLLGAETLEVRGQEKKYLLGY